MGAPQGNRQRPSRRDRGLSDLAQIRHLDLACAGIRARRRHFCAPQSPPTWDDISKLAVIATIRELFPGQRHFRLRPVQQSGAKGRKLESWAESGRLINWT